MIPDYKDRPRLFSENLAMGMGLKEAYLAAGYKDGKNAALLAKRLSERPAIARMLTELRDKASDKVGIEIERVLREAVRIGLFDMRRLFRADNSIKPPSEWDDDIAAVVASVDVKEFVTKNKDADGNRIIERTFKVRVNSKMDAIEKLAKHLGMYVERAEHDVTVTHYHQMTPEEIKFELAAIVDKVRNPKPNRPN